MFWIKKQVFTTLLVEGHSLLRLNAIVWDWKIYFYKEAFQAISFKTYFYILPNKFCFLVHICYWSPKNSINYKDNISYFLCRAFSVSCISNISVTFSKEINLIYEPILIHGYWKWIDIIGFWGFWRIDTFWGILSWLQGSFKLPILSVCTFVSGYSCLIRYLLRIDKSQIWTLYSFALYYLGEFWKPVSQLEIITESLISV